MKQTKAAEQRSGPDMNDAAREARREYLRKWREKNREHIREYYREWSRRNPDKVRANAARYWSRKGEELQAEANEAAGSEITHSVGSY